MKSGGIGGVGPIDGGKITKLGPEHSLDGIPVPQNLGSIGGNKGSKRPPQSEMLKNAQKLKETGGSEVSVHAEKIAAMLKEKLNPNRLYPEQES